MGMEVRNTRVGTRTSWFYESKRGRGDFGQRICLTSLPVRVTSVAVSDSLRHPVPSESRSNLSNIPWNANDFRALAHRATVSATAPSPEKTALPPQHPLRLELAEEVHARPPDAFKSPFRVSDRRANSRTRHAAHSPGSRAQTGILRLIPRLAQAA